MSVDESRDSILNNNNNEFQFVLSSSVPTKSTIENRNQHPVRYAFQKRPFIIGVSGGTSSGKSTVCNKIIEKLGPIDPTSIYLTHEKRVVRISQNSFYRKLTDEDRELIKIGEYNFDHPDAFDFELMYRILRDVRDGKMVRVPVYNYEINEISDEEEVIYPADVVLIEGLLLFYFPELRRFFHMKIFVDTDSDTRLSRRVLKDVKHRNRNLGVVLAQYLKFVKPSFEEYCLPSKKYADIVVPRGPDNDVAVDLIVTQIRSIYDPSTRHQSIKYHSYVQKEDYIYDYLDYILNLQEEEEKNNKLESENEANNKKNKSAITTATSSDTGWDESDYSEHFDDNKSHTPTGKFIDIHQQKELSSGSSLPRSNPIEIIKTNGQHRHSNSKDFKNENGHDDDDDDDGHNNNDNDNDDDLMYQMDDDVISQGSKSRRFLVASR